MGDQAEKLAPDPWHLPAKELDEVALLFQERAPPPPSKVFLVLKGNFVPI